MAVTAKGIHRVLAGMPRQPRAWLRPTFLVTRSHPLPPVYIAVLSVDKEAGTATYEVLGCPATPATVSIEALRTMLEQRGTKQ